MPAEAVRNMQRSADPGGPNRLPKAKKIAAKLGRPTSINLQGRTYR